jgi:hypothetical protein
MRVLRELSNLLWTKLAENGREYPVCCDPVQLPLQQLSTESLYGPDSEQ